jgi:hypothetical protein
MRSWLRKYVADCQQIFEVQTQSAENENYGIDCHNVSSCLGCYQIYQVTGKRVCRLFFNVAFQLEFITVAARMSEP